MLLLLPWWICESGLDDWVYWWKLCVMKPNNVTSCSRPLDVVFWGMDTEKCVPKSQRQDMGVIISVFNVTRVHRGGPLLGGQRSGSAASSSQKQHQRELVHKKHRLLVLLILSSFFCCFMLHNLACLPHFAYGNCCRSGVQHYLWISVHFKTCRLTHQGLICKANFQASAVSSRFWLNICKFLPCLQWSLGWF